MCGDVRRTEGGVSRRGVDYFKGFSNVVGCKKLQLKLEQKMDYGWNLESVFA